MTEKQKSLCPVLAGTDALGRRMPAVTGWKPDKYVGVFYWLWHGGSSAERDTTKLLQEHPEEFWDPYDGTGIAPAGGMYYFNEPLYGYYSSQDVWVLRKHIELFVYAGVDFLGLDYTNSGAVFEKALRLFLDLLEEYRQAGWKVPQLVFLTNTGSAGITSWLYQEIYQKNLYPELWFYGPYEKPLITVGGDDLAAGVIPREILDFFHVRPSQWPGFEFPFYEDGFSWCDLNRPQKVHQDMINVAVAQHHAYIFSYGLKVDPKVTPRGINYGRGYTVETGENGNVPAILAGANIQEHWDYAISQDPAIVFVTGWNEWATNKRPAFFEGQTVAAFVDSFNTEFSRDMEMTKNPTYVLDEKTGEYRMEGYGDNYYMQMVQNIRRFKGVAGTSEANPYCRSKRYDNVATANPARDCAGYRQAPARNFLRTIRVEHNLESLIFTLETQNDIALPEPEQTNWMNLFLEVEGHKAPQWEHRSFLVNRLRNDSGAASLEIYNGSEFIPQHWIPCKLEGQRLRLTVPRTWIGADHSDFVVRFQFADGVREERNLLDYYVSGCVVPLGRLLYEYRGE